MNKFFKKNDSTNTSTLYDSWSFSNINYYIFIIGLIMIILGYFVMINGKVYSFQSLTLAPLLLFGGYIIVIPTALLFKKKKDLGS